jgi:hypothetical protein
MRVCQFRHYGTVTLAPHRWPEHANREPLVFQTPSPLSMQMEPLRDFAGSVASTQVGELEDGKPGGTAGETSDKKRRLLVEEGDISQNDRTEKRLIPGPARRRKNS